MQKIFFILFLFVLICPLPASRPTSCEENESFKTTPRTYLTTFSSQSMPPIVPPKDISTSELRRIKCAQLRENYKNHWREIKEILLRRQEFKFLKDKQAVYISPIITDQETAMNNCFKLPAPPRLIRDLPYWEQQYQAYRHFIRTHPLPVFSDFLDFTHMGLSSIAYDLSWHQKPDSSLTSIFTRALGWLLQFYQWTVPRYNSPPLMGLENIQADFTMSKPKETYGLIYFDYQTYNTNQYYAEIFSLLKPGGILIDDCYDFYDPFLALKNLTAAGFEKVIFNENYNNSFNNRKATRAVVAYKPSAVLSENQGEKMDKGKSKVI